MVDPDPSAVLYTLSKVEHLSRLSVDQGPKAKVLRIFRTKMCGQADRNLGTLVILTALGKTKGASADGLSHVLSRLSS